MNDADIIESLRDIADMIADEEELEDDRIIILQAADRLVELTAILGEYRAELLRHIASSTKEQG